MSNGKGLSTVLAEWAQVASALVGVAALLAAVFVGQRTVEQGELQRQEAMTQQTLQFFASFNSADMLQTRELLDNEDWCVRYGYRPPDPGYQSQVTAAHIVSFVDFFDAVDKSCPPASGPNTACDREFAEGLFRPYAADLYDNLSKDILERREQRGDSNFGAGMASLANDQAPLEQVVARYAQECR
jgi:hypothetical protein